MNNTTTQALNWRYATKAFDTEKKLTDEQLSLITEALRLSASSFGLQPWKFVVVTNPEVRKQLREAAWNQPQITDASHLIVLSVRTDVDASFVDKFVQSVADTRGMPVDALKEYSDMMKGSVASRTPEAVKEWSSRQVYIPLGTALLAAAENQIDACPMEGFDNAKFDEILGLKAHNAESRVVLAVGFRSPEDKTAEYKKVRFPESEVFIKI